MRIHYFVVYATLILLLTSGVHGLTVNIQNGKYAQIQSVYSVDKIVNNDLYVNLSISIHTNPEIREHFESLTLIIDPFETTIHNSAENFYVTGCLGPTGGGGYDAPAFECRNPLTIRTKPVSKHSTEYAVDIPLQNWNNNYGFYSVNVQYLLPNFIKKQGSKYLAWFTTRCRPEASVCPADAGIIRIFVLPTLDSLIEKLPESTTKVDGFHKKWVVETKMTGEKHDQLWYWKTNEVERITPLFWAFVGTLLGFILTLFAEEFLNVRQWLKKIKKCIRK